MDPLFRGTALSAGITFFLGRSRETRIHTSLPIYTALGCLYKLEKMAAKFLVPRVRELPTHTLIRVIWEFPACLAICTF